MKVSVKSLVAAVSAIDLVPSRAGISSSEFIRIKGGKRLTLSLAAEIYGTTYAKAEEPDAKAWEFWVDRASMVPFVMAAKELGQKTPFELIYSDEKGKQLIIKCGRRKAVFQTVTEISGYTDAAEFKGGELVLTPEQKLVLSLAARYATSDPTVSHLNCIYLKKGKAVMSSNQLAAFYMEDKVAPMSVPLPILLLSILDSDQVKSVVVSPKFARINLRCGFLCQLTNQKAALEFPHQRIVDSMAAAAKYRRRFTLKAVPFLAVLKRLEAYIAAVVKRDMVIGVRGKAGDIKLRLTANVPQGRFEESVTVVHPLKRDVDCELLLGLLLPLSEFAKDLANIEVHWDDMSPFYFKASGLQLLLSRKS